jgi:hypothetical protein
MGTVVSALVHNLLIDVPMKQVRDIPSIRFVLV